MTFTDKESAYLDSQLLGRLATIGPDGAPRNVPVGAPRNVPVGFHLNPELGTIDIGGHSAAARCRFRAAGSVPPRI